MTICPCCGFKSDSIVSSVAGKGCTACGARAVGEPLPRPEHELPSYGRSLVLAVIGTLMVLLFLAQLVGSFTQNVSTYKTTRETFYAAGVAAFDFVTWSTAAQTAAWRLKWVAIPLAILVLFGSRRLYRSIKESPSRFCGLRYARRGYIASAAVTLLILVLIGVSVPTRLEHHEWGIEAGENVVGLTFGRAIFEYSLRYQRIPNDLSDLRQLPDPNGSIAAALNTLDPSTYPNAYRPYAELAAKQKPRTLRGAVIRNASINSVPDEPLSEGLSFTNYELRLPGPDKVNGTEDDLIVRDGVVTKASETPRRLGSTTTSTQKPNQ